MNRQQLIQYTKTLIDEVSPVDGLEDDIQIADYGSDKPIDDFIDSVLQESANETQLVAPTYYLDAVYGAVTYETDGNCHFTKPTDFLKLLRVQLTYWERPVNVTTQEGSVRADIQYNPYLKGGNAKPVVLEKKRELVLVPGSNKDTGTEPLEYAKVKLPEEVAEPLQIPMCWLAASKVFGIVGNLNANKVAKDHFVELIQEVKRREL